MASQIVLYSDFIANKSRRAEPSGIDTPADFGPTLFGFQRDLVRWALRRGRAAMFADTGLGKTRMELTWASLAGSRVLVLAPLAVGAQTVAEGERIGIQARLVREAGDVADGVNVINYERIHKLDASQFDAVVLDESSIIKHHDAKTLKALMDAFGRTPMRLCATATPSPNDYTELGTHAEFLGVCTRQEMLAEFFCHDGGETQVWRLKGHARKAFWEWVASWGALVRLPSDLGYSDAGYALPPYSTREHIVRSDDESVKRTGMLFAMPAQSLMERRDARRGSLGLRVDKCAELVNSNNERWVIWCDLNAEGDALETAIPDAIQISGADSVDEKERLLEMFSSGEARVLISKPSICGFGLNWQHCARMAFVGVTDSWEAYYQAVRRIWRFGQKRECEVHIFASELEGSVLQNLKRKESDAKKMAEELSRETRAAVAAQVVGKSNVLRMRIKDEPYFPAWIHSDARAAQ